MRFIFKLKKFYVIFATMLSIFFIFLRVRSFFRQPIDISLPYTFEFIILLLFFDILFCILFFFNLKKNNIQNTYIIKVYSWFINLFVELHLWLATNVKTYGKFYNILNIFVHCANIVVYYYYLIIVSIVIPYCILFGLLIFECLYMKKIYLTFKFLPLLLLPLFLQLFLSGLIEFINHQLNLLENELIFTPLTLENSKVLGETFYSDLNLVDQYGIYVSRKPAEQCSKYFSHLADREIYYYYNWLGGKKKW